MSKRSKSVEVVFVSMVAAAALAGCNAEEAYHRDWQQCVDQNNAVVDDRYCDQRTSTTGGVGGAIPYYYWMYSPRPYGMGQVITGGYATPRPNVQTTRASGAAVSEGGGSSTVVRGGFGSSAHEGGATS